MRFSLLGAILTRVVRLTPAPQRRWILGAPAAFLLCVLSSASVSAQSESIQLTAESPTLTGTLVGALGGSFQTVSFNSPGAHRPVALRLDVDRPRGTLGHNIGFNVYRATDGAWAARAIPLNADPTQATAFASVSHARQVPFSVQIYNYLPGVAVRFTLTARFAPIAGAPESRGAPVLYAEDPIGAGRVDGLGAGSGDAASANYLLAYPGRFAPLDVTLAFSGSAKETPRILSTSVGAYLWAGRKLIACSGPSRRLWSQPTGLTKGHARLLRRASSVLNAPVPLPGIAAAGRGRLAHRVRGPRAPLGWRGKRAGPRLTDLQLQVERPPGPRRLRRPGPRPAVSPR